MTERERLTDLILNAPKLEFPFGSRAQGKTYQTAQNIADHLLANGVIVPPCKVGGTVYVICNQEVQETSVFSMKAETEDNHYVFYIKAKAVDGTNKTVDGYVSVFKTFMFGKTVFLTKEEAEKALKEREGKE